MTKRFRLDTGCIIDQQKNQILSDEQIRNTLNNLHNENLHIKNTIQEAYNNERTHIGKNVLKQLLESI